MDKLLEWLGAYRYYSTLDLKKIYWQILLIPMCREKKSLHNVVWITPICDTSVRAVQGIGDVSVSVLGPHTAYAATYIDDIIIFSNTWQWHMQHLRANI